MGYPILKLNLTKRRLTYRAKSSTILYGLIIHGCYILMTHNTAKILPYMLYYNTKHAIYSSPEH